MGQDYFDFLIDLALDSRDFKWVEELKEKRYDLSKENKANIRGKTSQDIVYDFDDDSDLTVLDTGVVLEDLNTNYAVVDEYGISNLVDDTNDVVMNREIVYCFDLYKKGELGEYMYLDYEEQGYVKGFLVGQKMYQDMTMELLDNMINEIDKKENKKKWWQFWKRDK